MTADDFTLHGPDGPPVDAGVSAADFDQGRAALDVDRPRVGGRVTDSLTDALAKYDAEIERAENSLTVGPGIAILAGAALATAVRDLLAAGRAETRVGVGTGAGEGDDPAQAEATFRETRSTDCPEAPAQAHPHPTTDDARTEAHIKLRADSGNTYEGPISGVLDTHLATGWHFESLTATSAESTTATIEDAQVEAAVAAWTAHGTLAFPVEGREPSCAECGYAFDWLPLSAERAAARTRGHQAREALRAAGLLARGLPDRDEVILAIFDDPAPWPDLTRTEQRQVIRVLDLLRGGGHR